MLIPDYQAIMVPLLRAVADDEEHSLGELIGSLASEFGFNRPGAQRALTQWERPQIRQQVRWPGTYLKKAGLLESPRRGRLPVTQRGLQILIDRPTAIMITTSGFSRDAREYAERLKAKTIVLQSLAELMIDHGIGVKERATYTVKGLAPDYFEGETRQSPDSHRSAIEAR